MFSPDSDAFTHMEAVARETFSRYGFTELRTPILERTELFCRGIGTETDVVQKEMYTFPDRKGRSLTLRPEATAGVMRAYIESGRSGDAVPSCSPSDPCSATSVPRRGVCGSSTRSTANASGLPNPTRRRTGHDGHALPRSAGPQGSEPPAQFAGLSHMPSRLPRDAAQVALRAG